MSVSNTGIPFLDLVTPHVELEQELTKVFQQALRTAGFIGGPMVEEFEKAFAAFCETKHSVAVSSGTDALRFALMAAGVRERRRRGDRSPHVYRDDGSDFAGGRVAGVCRRRRAHLQHGSGETARVSRAEVYERRVRAN